MRTVLRVLASALAVPLAFAFGLVVLALISGTIINGPATSMLAILALAAGIAIGGAGALGAGWLVWRKSRGAELKWGLPIMGVWLVLAAVGLLAYRATTKPMYDSDAEVVPLETVRKELEYREAGPLPPGAEDIHIVVHSAYGQMCLRFQAPPDESQQFVQRTLKRCWGWTRSEYPLYEPRCHKEWWRPPESIPWRGDMWRVVKMDEETGMVYFAGQVPD